MRDDPPWRLSGLDAPLVSESDGHRQAVTLSKSSRAAESVDPAGLHLAGRADGQLIEVGSGEPPLVVTAGRGRDITRIDQLPGLDAGVAHVVEILTLNPNIAGCAGAGEVASDQRVERVAQRGVVGVQVTGDVRSAAQGMERNPAGDYNVDQHQDPLPRQVDEDVAVLVVEPVVAQLNPVQPSIEGHLPV